MNTCTYTDSWNDLSNLYGIKKSCTNIYTNITTMNDKFSKYIKTAISYNDTETWHYDKSAWLEEKWFSNSNSTTTAVFGNYLDDLPAYAWRAPIAPGDRLRQMIQARIAPAIRRSRTSMSIAMDVREQRARQTLRRIIGEQTFRKFMRDGFITVVPKSGLTYKIYPGLGMTEVYDRGIMVDRLCVVLKGSFPPTDSLLMRYLLILNDEGEFSEYAIKHHVSQGSKKLVFSAEEVQPLTEAWAKLKVA